MQLDHLSLVTLLLLMLFAGVEPFLRLQPRRARAVASAGTITPRGWFGAYRSKTNSRSSRSEGKRGRVGSRPTKAWRGHIEQLGPHHFRIRVDLGRDGNGKRHRRSYTLRGTRADAEEKLRELLKDVDDELLTVSGGPRTVNDLAALWLERFVKTHKRPTTYKGYSDLYRIYVRESLGSLPVKDVTTAGLTAFMDQLYRRPLKERVPKSATAFYRRRKRGAAWQPAASGVSEPAKMAPPGSVEEAEERERARREAALVNRDGYLSHESLNKVLAVLKGLFGYAAEQGFVKVSPAAPLRRYKRKRSRMETLTREERIKLINEARGTRWFALIYLLATSGLRPSEALALTYDDVDLEQLTVTVNKKLTYFNKDSYIFENATKSDAGDRDIPLLEEVAAALEEHMQWQKKVGAYDPALALVFGDDRGNPVDSRWVMNSILKPLAHQVGIKKNVTNYTFRHTVGTAIGRTKDWTALKEILGHSSVRTGMDNYDHPDDKRKRNAVKGLGLE